MNHYEEEWQNEEHAREILIFNLGDLSRKLSPDSREMHEFYMQAERIFVSFRFNWETYESSDIVITGRAYNSDGSIAYLSEKMIHTPRVQQIGGCWSNYVALRLLSSQTMISTMLENVTNTLIFLVKYKLKKDITVTKVDRCFYAPYLYFTEDEHIFDNPRKTEYMPYLIQNHPEAYQQVLNRGRKATGYWNDYHDADMEAAFEK